MFFFEFQHLTRTAVTPDEPIQAVVFIVLCTMIILMIFLSFFFCFAFHFQSLDKIHANKWIYYDIFIFDL